MNARIVIFLALFLAFSAISQAAPKSKDAKDKLVSSTWYTVLVGGKVPYEYYNERVELRKGRLFFQNQAWKKEEDYINEEQLGAFAEDDASLTPLFFNFHSTYRTTELSIDGTVSEKNGARQLTVKVRKGAQDLPLVKRSLPTNVFFSTFFPIWLERHLSLLTKQHSLSFSAVLEDNIDVEFAPVPGRASLEPPDAFAQENGTRKIGVQYKDNKSDWYVDDQGSARRILLVEQKTIVDRVTEAQAKAFLKQ